MNPVKKGQMQPAPKAGLERAASRQLKNFANQGNKTLSALTLPYT
jgi:hypothetical protein